MKTQQIKVISEAARGVVIVAAIYTALWLTGFHDASRRWMLLVCLFGVWASFIIGGSFTAGARRLSKSEPEESNQGRWASIFGFVALVALMLGLGVVLRFTA